MPSSVRILCFIMSAALNSLGIVKAIFTLCRQTVLEGLWWSCSELKSFFERKKEERMKKFFFFFLIFSCFEGTDNTGPVK